MAHRIETALKRGVPDARGKAVAAKAKQFLVKREQALEELELLIQNRRNDLTVTYPEKLVRLREKITAMRAGRLLALAAQSAEEIREAQAKALFTSADIEISKMENTVRSLQEAVQ